MGIAAPGDVASLAVTAGEHTASGLLAKLAADCDATPQQLDLVRESLEFFKAEGVIDQGRGLPLFEACPCASECWRVFPPEDYPPREQAEVAVPWVGRDYTRHRIAVVAINFNFYGGLGAQWWVRRGDIHERLGHGKRNLFPYRVGQYLAAVVASQRADPVIEDPDPAAGAAGFESCAFVQGVQCSPKPRAGRPSAAMWDNCPPRYLAGQLELLRPSVVLAVGRETWRWVRDPAA